ncbi:hypothetical protein PTKIN_Ptkin12aG0013300 [Pterospermum kingtungense]
MSETMSSPTNWPEFYQHSNLSNQDIPSRVRVVSSEPMLGDGGSEASTIVSTTIMSPISPIGSVGPAGSSIGDHLSPEGRVGKPARRRSRASRRTPTTLLNTDTTNFRAMVQQFTGGPTAPFAPAGHHHPGAPNYGFSFGGREPYANPSALMVPPAGFQLQYQQQPQVIQHQNQPYMFSMNSNNNINAGAADLLLQRLGVGGNPRPNMEGVGSDGFVVEGVPSQVPASRTTSSNGNRSDVSFMF